MSNRPWLKAAAAKSSKLQAEKAHAKRQAYLPAVRQMITAGATLRSIGATLGIAQSQVSRICRENDVPFPIMRGGFVQDQPWQVSDVADLTDAQLEEADRYGIPPGRFSWLLKCPKNTVHEGRLLRK